MAARSRWTPPASSPSRSTPRACTAAGSAPTACRTWRASRTRPCRCRSTLRMPRVLVAAADEKVGSDQVDEGAGLRREDLALADQHAVAARGKPGVQGADGQLPRVGLVQADRADDR